MKRLCIALLFFAAFWLRASDVALLTDGDRLTGALQKLDNGKLFFLTKYSDTPLQIDWALVSNLTTDAEITLTLRDGSEKAGKFVATSEGLAFVDSNGTKEVERSVVISLKRKDPADAERPLGWFRHAWSKSSVVADFGQSYSGLAVTTSCPQIRRFTTKETVGTGL